MKKKVLCFILILMATFAQAQNKRDFADFEELTMPQPSRSYCSANLGPLMDTKAVFETDIRWVPGQTIRIKFLESNTTRMNGIKSAVNTWKKYANLHFVYVTSGDAEIRIAFDDTAGSWSFPGNISMDPNYGSQSDPSMNIAWDGESTALHEMGHALALLHEHQSPSANISWDRNAVIADLSGAPNYWTLGQIERNVLRTLDSSLHTYSEFDDTSIMMYGFPASWTTNGYSGPSNNTLSDRDKSFTRDPENYPFTVYMVDSPYSSITNGAYEMVGEYEGYPVFQRTGGGHTWSIYHRKITNRWVLDFDDIDEEWAGTVDYSESANPLPFMSAWSNGGACSGTGALTVNGISPASNGTYELVKSRKGYPVYQHTTKGYRIYRGKPFLLYNSWVIDTDAMGDNPSGVIHSIKTNEAVVYWTNWGTKGEVIPQ